MHRQKFESRNIAAAGYDVREHVLEIEFRSGGVYRYHEVSMDVWNALLNAQSKGTYFGQQIRGSYRTTKLDAHGREVDPGKAKASAASIDLLRRLATKAGIWSGSASDRMGPAWRHVYAAAGGQGQPPDVTVETWLGALLQPQCSAAIELLKARVS